MSEFTVTIILPPKISKSGRKHKLRVPADFTCATGIRPHKHIETPYLRMTKTGELTCKKNYAIDGSSGAADTLNSIEPAFVHDALCQLIRTGHLPMSALGPANDLYRDLCMARGMASFRAKARRLGLRIGSKRAVRKGKAT